MPEQWTKKEEKQYDKIKKSAKNKAKSTKRAEEIAARTVNKERRKKGKTSNKKTEGTGNPHKGLESKTKDELYNRAKELCIEGRSNMNKSDLIKAIRKRS